MYNVSMEHVDDSASEAAELSNQACVIQVRGKTYEAYVSDGPAIGQSFVYRRNSDSNKEHFVAETTSVIESIHRLATGSYELTTINGSVLTVSLKSKINVKRYSSPAMHITNRLIARLRNLFSSTTKAD